MSGANGYIAVWLVKKLLEDGFSVRGTIRSPSREAHLKSVFKEYGDKFELVIVPDITAVRRLTIPKSSYVLSNKQCPSGWSIR